MAFVEQVDVEGFSGPELQHILTNTPHRSKLIFNSKYFKRLHIYKQFLFSKDENICAGFLRAAGWNVIKMRAAGRACVSNFGPRATLILTRIMWSKVSIALNFDQLSLLTVTYSHPMSSTTC